MQLYELPTEGGYLIQLHFFDADKLKIELYQLIQFGGCLIQLEVYQKAEVYQVDTLRKRYIDKSNNWNCITYSPAVVPIPLAFALNSQPQ